MPPHYTVVPRLLSTSLPDRIWVASGSILTAIEELPILTALDIGSFLRHWDRRISTIVEAMDAMDTMSSAKRQTGAGLLFNWVKLHRERWTHSACGGVSAEELN